MDTSQDLPLQETRLWLDEQAARRFRKIPSELIAAHVLAITEGADFPVRRAALEALHRRMQNVESEGLFARETPVGALLGRYVVAKTAEGETSGNGRKRHEVRPYETILESFSPLRGQCSCPDYLKGSLGLCKHLLTAFAWVCEKPKRIELALRESQAPRLAAVPQLTWNPVIPLLGSGDRLLGLQLVGCNCATLDGFNRAGRVELTQLGDADKRAAFLGRALQLTHKRGRAEALIGAGPAVIALLNVELQSSERRAAAEREAKLVLSHLKGLKRKLYPYQLQGVKRFLEQGRLLLADDMGLGKTTQAIAGCHALFHAGKVKRGLVITPAALKPQWYREWQATTDVPVFMVDGPTPERQQVYRTVKRGFLILNYELLLREFDRSPLLQEKLRYWTRLSASRTTRQNLLCT